MNGRKVIIGHHQTIPAWPRATAVKQNMVMLREIWCLFELKYVCYPRVKRHTDTHTNTNTRTKHKHTPTDMTN